jgi:hypothetical protein
MRVCLTVLAAALLVPTQVSAYSLPYAKYFNQLCQTNSREAQLAMRLYVQGLLDQRLMDAARVAAFLQLNNHETDLDRAQNRADKVLNVCIPDAVDVAVIQRAFCAHLAAHPEKHDQTAVGQFSDAIAKTWPCS